jgi:hypothetical protein
MSKHEQPWLVDLAMVQHEQPLSTARYDDTEQLTLQEPNIRLIDAGGNAPTKKADREVGEDQKAHW